MREILFRGKRVDNGEWVDGYLAETDCINSVVIDNSVGFKTYDEYQIHPESVGQFTGLLDKNGRKIFEGDVYEVDFEKYVITFYEGAFCAGRILKDKYQSAPLNWEPRGTTGLTVDGFSNFIEIIGNIHDNPELIGKEAVHG